MPQMWPYKEKRIKGKKRNGGFLSKFYKESAVRRKQDVCDYIKTAFCSVSIIHTFHNFVDYETISKTRLTTISGEIPTTKGGGGQENFKKPNKKMGKV